LLDRSHPLQPLLVVLQAKGVLSFPRNLSNEKSAEGVETSQQHELLRSLGCEEMQGYLFSPATPAAEIRRLLYSDRGRAVA
jgi:EAL domain-containing protein (putative c-di-GMP-specific phosphodiesterase class I)